MEALKITQVSPIFSDNLLNNFWTFNKDVDYTGWNNQSGTGVSGATDTFHFKGDRSLNLFSTNKAVKYTINAPGQPTSFQSVSGKLYRIQFYLLNPSGGQTSGTLFSFNLFQGASETNYDVTADMLESTTNFWFGFYFDFIGNGSVLDFTLSKPINAASGDSAIYFDGFKLEVVDKERLAYPSIYSEPSIQLPPTPADGKFYMDKTGGFNTWKPVADLLPTHLTVPIDFPSIAANDFYDYEYDASPLTFLQGQLMLVNTFDETIPAINMRFSAKRKGATGADVSKILIRAWNPTASPINLGSSSYNLTIFP